MGVDAPQFRHRVTPRGSSIPDRRLRDRGYREYSTQTATSPATFRSLYHPKNRPIVAVRRNWAQFGLSLRERQSRIMPTAPDVHPDAGADEAPRIPFVRDPTFWQAGCAAAAGDAPAIDQRLIDDPAGRVTTAPPETAGGSARRARRVPCRIERTLSEPEWQVDRPSWHLQHADGVQPEQLSRYVHGCAGTSECPLDGNCSGAG